ncbi:MAG: hypothetical protein GXP32_10280 [Kiritimatiellaeota bacterium]|nr:hypothetical protein [Kiritimatiellota bacterium]
MREKENFKWFVAGFAIFSVSRFLVIYGYDRYWSDVALYHEAAFYAVEKGYRAYHDFWFPYPPMALPLIYAPMLFAKEISAYRHFFQWEMFIFDLGAAVYLVLFMTRRLRAAPKRVFMALALYSAFGMLTGHLIYDRLDIVLGFVFISSLYHFTSDGFAFAGKWVAYVFTLLGALAKVVPLLWTPLFVIIGFFNPWSGARERGNSGKGMLGISAANFAGALAPAAVLAVFALAIFAYDAATTNEKVGKGLLIIMSEHGERGIQMESVWAMPMVFANLAREIRGEAIKFHLETTRGAQHYKSSELSSAYVTAAKFAGFAALAGMFCAIFAAAVFKPGFRSRLSSPEWILTAMLGVLLFVIATQRVLSPQYLIWLMPGAAAAVFMRDRVSFPALSLFSAIFALTYVEFDIGYEALTRSEPWCLVVLTLRNLLLILAAALFMTLIFKSDGYCSTLTFTNER